MSKDVLMISASRVFQPSWLAQAADTQNSHPATPAASVTHHLIKHQTWSANYQAASLRPFVPGG